MPPLQTQADIDALLAFLVWPLGGAAFGVVSYLKTDREGFRKRQFAKTVLVFAAGGVAAYLGGDEFSEESIVAGAALAAPVVNQLLDGWLSGSKGGSPTGNFRFGSDRR